MGSRTSPILLTILRPCTRNVNKAFPPFAHNTTSEDTGAIARTQADDILEQDMKQGLSKTASLFNFLFDNGRTEEIEINQQRQKP